jgi:hypothetical protein
MHVTDYPPCQMLAEMARISGVQLISYCSVRDPHHRANIAILSCRAFAKSEPVAHQTWQLLFGSNGARAICEWLRQAIDLNRAAFLRDPRIDSINWER